MSMTKSGIKDTLGVLYVLLILFFQIITLFVSSSFTGFLSVCIIAASALYVITALQQYQLPKVMKVLVWMMLLFTIYGLVLILSGKVLYMREIGDIMPSHRYLVEIYKSILPIFAFFTLTKMGILTEKRMRILFIAFFIIAVLNYIYYRNFRLELVQESNEYATDVTNGAGYDILSLLPFMIFFDKWPRLRYFILAVMTILILYAIKRGAIIILVLCLLFYIPKLIKNSSRLAKITSIILLSLVIYYAYLYIENFVSNNSYFSDRLERISEGDLEARSVIWVQLWDSFIHGDIIHMFIGHGAWATLDISINFAHNDWLEILTNQGLVGIGLFGVYWFAYYSSWRKTKQDSSLYLLLGLLFITHFTRCFFSMSISDMTIYASCLTGYAFARYSTFIKNKQTNSKTMFSDSQIVVSNARNIK